MIKHTVGDGKYTITFDIGVLSAERYDNKNWRDLTGDGMVLAMLQEIDELKKQLQLRTLECMAREILKDPHIRSFSVEDGIWEFGDVNGHPLSHKLDCFKDFKREFDILTQSFDISDVEIDLI